MTGIECTDCSQSVELCVVSAEKFEKTRKQYGGSVKTIGERIDVNLGLACGCTSFRSHRLRTDGLENGYFHEYPEKWPDNWGDGQ